MSLPFFVLWSLVKYPNLSWVFRLKVSKGELSALWVCKHLYIVCGLSGYSETSFSQRSDPELNRLAVYFQIVIALTWSVYISAVAYLQTECAVLCKTDRQLLFKLLVRLFKLQSLRSNSEYKTWYLVFECVSLAVKYVIPCVRGAIVIEFQKERCDILLCNRQSVLCNVIKSSWVKVRNGVNELACVFYKLVWSLAKVILA